MTTSVRRPFKTNETTYRLVLPWTIILMGHCLLVHSLFTMNVAREERTRVNSPLME